MTSVKKKVIDKLYSYVDDVVNDYFNDKEDTYHILWHSNIDQFNQQGDDYTIYVNNYTVKEYQDSLSTNVGMIGKRRFQSICILTVSIYAKISTSMSSVIGMDLAETVKNKFRGFDDNCIEISDEITATEDTHEYNCYRWHVHIPYSFFELV